MQASVGRNTIVTGERSRSRRVQSSSSSARRPNARSLGLRVAAAAPKDLGTSGRIAELKNGKVRDSDPPCRDCRSENVRVRADQMMQMIRSLPFHATLRCAFESSVGCVDELLFHGPRGGTRGLSHRLRCLDMFTACRRVPERGEARL